MRIDLNSDLGEGFGIGQLGDDDALLKIFPPHSAAAVVVHPDQARQTITVESAGASGA